jgi:hypothetical protein
MRIWSPPGALFRRRLGAWALAVAFLAALPALPGAAAPVAGAVPGHAGATPGGPTSGPFRVRRA